MSYDIIVRFLNKELADRFCAQMGDGYGTELCAFSYHQQIEGTDGTRPEHYEKILVDGKPVYFVDEMFDEFGE